MGHSAAADADFGRAPVEGDVAGLAVGGVLADHAVGRTGNAGRVGGVDDERLYAGVAQRALGAVVAVGHPRRAQGAGVARLVVVGEAGQAVCGHRIAGRAAGRAGSACVILKDRRVTAGRTITRYY